MSWDPSVSDNRGVPLRGVLKVVARVVFCCSVRDLGAVGPLELDFGVFPCVGC